ncbi:hypothetical protein, partial [Streptomyces sp. Ru87]|uniref:hypothetical protein n=1 Tax=Streptomyces sp. Ru87 TaxID=2044307 RepID=UPI000BFA936A
DGGQPRILLLPPYLRDLRAPGLASVSGLDGYESVLGDLRKAVKGSEESVAGIRDELTGRPESFFGRGRSFHIRGRGAPSAWYDVTLAVTADPAETPPRFVEPPADAPRPGPGTGPVPAPAPGQPRELSDPDDAATKLDLHRNSGGSASRGHGRSSRYGGSAAGMGLVPTPVPGLTAGVAFNVGAHPFHTADESRTQRTVNEHRVLRSDEGTVRVPRRVRFTLRTEHSALHTVQRFDGTGSLDLLVPREHLVPALRSALGPMAELDGPQARSVRLADSLAAVAVTEPPGEHDPHDGGDGLFDTVKSVLHPSLTGPGAPGRARLYAATSAATVAEDLPRLLGGWVTGEDLVAKDGSTEGSYRMRATLSGLAPGWSAGRTQLRTHQQAQHSEANSHGQGRGGQVGVGPAVGAGVLDAGPRARVGVLPLAEARKMRFASADQSIGVRQGAEIRGDKVLYRGRVVIAVEGNGPLSPAMKAGRQSRSAEHTMDVWVTLRAEEARHLGLPLPPGTAAKDLFVRERDENGAEAGRHLPFGAMGGSVSLSGLDTGPLISGIEQLFATHPKLAGCLPAHGDAPAPTPEPPRTPGKLRKKQPEKKFSREEQTAQRENYRQLLTVLSETNLRANKEQLLSSGVPVRLRRKTTWTSHDALVRVSGEMGELTWLGDTGDWLTRSTAGVTTGLQSGRAGARGGGVRAVGQVRLIPGALSGQVTGDALWQGTRRDQGGPTTRTDSLSNGDTRSSAFGGPLRLSVQVTLVERERTAKRALTPGAPGRDTPEVERIASSADDAADNPLRLGTQDVRLTTPSAFTLDDENHQLLEARAGRRRATPLTPVAESGIGELTSGSWQPRGRTVRDWQFVETAGSGEPVRAMAYELLAKAAARNDAVRRDRAFETDGLAPRLAIEERLSARAVSAALRQGVSSGWVVKNLRHPRRLAALSGAVGTRFALTRPRVVHRDSGAGTENYVLGGHQASGQRGRGRSGGFRAQGLSMQDNQVLHPGDDPKWRIGEAVGASWTLAGTSNASESLAGSIERNAHSPRGRDLYLVQCDLAMRMSAEVTVGGRPYVASAERTVPAEVSVWLTKEQCEAAGIPLRTPAERAAERRAAREQGEADRAAGRTPASLLPPGERPREGAADGPAPAAPAVTPAQAGVPAQLRQGTPPGFGMIEQLPDFRPLIRQLRTEGGAKARALARELLPERQSDDPYDNVQRLLRVLDRDGATGLLAGAMDGGVTVELFRGRRTPYWAEFAVEATGPGSVGDRASDGRDMEYITSAVSGRSDSEEESGIRGVDAMVTGAGKPELGQHPVKSTGAAAGLGAGSSSSRKRGSSGRGQTGVKTVADAKAESRGVTVPVRGALTLRSSEGVIARTALEGDLVHRILEHDLRALDRVTPVRDGALAGRNLKRTGGDDPSRLARWRSLGVTLPDEAQVNGFRGAPGIRGAVREAVRAAHGGSRFHDTGQAAAYAQQEAVSTEWLASALPLLASAGVKLPPAHATGVAGQDLETSLHAQLTHGRVLDAGDTMTFEAIAPSSPDGDRPTGQDHQHGREHGKNVRGAAGAGLLNAQEFRLNEALLRSDNGGAVTDNAAAGSGSMPVRKPRTQSVLVQFDLRVRVVARVRNRATRRVESAVRDHLVPTPVIVRMPAPAVRRMLASARDGAKVADPHGRLGAPAGGVQR